MAWAQLIGSAISAYGNYKSNKRNEEQAEKLFNQSIDAVKPRPVVGGLGTSSYTDEGGTVFGLNDKYQAEADYALADAAANKGWLSQYQEGGPTAAANVLAEQRMEPLRRQQEREQQLFDEQELARGMLYSAPTDSKQEAFTEGWGNVYSGVVNQSFMDVQDIIDRYRDRISGSLGTAVDLENIPMSYAEFAREQGSKFAPSDQAIQGVTEANQGSNTYLGEAATSLGGWIGKNKFPTSSPSTGMMRQTQRGANNIGSRIDRSYSFLR